MKKQLHILVITNSFPNRHKPYAGKYIERHVSLHRAAGLKVTVLAPGDSRQGLFRSAWKYMKLVFQTLQAMVSLKFDLVHAHWELPSGLLGVIVTCIRRKSLLITSHGAFIHHFEKRPWPIRYLVRWVLRQADLVITVGQEQQLQVQAIAGLSPQQVKAINMGVWLPQNAPDLRTAREVLKLPEGEPIILFVGNLSALKGIDILLKAASILLDADQSFILVIGGQGPAEHAIRQQIRQLGLDNVVKVIGFVPPEDVFTWFSAADACAVPSRLEAFGLVAIEAMACGTPVVAADVGGLKETIKHDENGLLFPMDDHIALAKQLQRVLTDQKLKKKLIEAGYTTAAQHNMHLKSSQVKEVYLGLIPE